MAKATTKHGSLTINFHSGSDADEARSAARERRLRSLRKACNGDLWLRRAWEWAGVTDFEAEIRRLEDLEREE